MLLNLSKKKWTGVILINSLQTSSMWLWCFKQYDSKQDTSFGRCA